MVKNHINLFENENVMGKRSAVFMQEVNVGSKQGDDRQTSEGRSRGETHCMGGTFHGR